jgi:hypothetical protein
MRGGERVDVIRNYTKSKVIMLFVCGCYESELCLRVIRGVFIPPMGAIFILVGHEPFLTSAKMSKYILNKNINTTCNTFHDFTELQFT